LSGPRGAGKIHGYWFQNEIQLIVSTAVSGSIFEKRFQELVSKGVSEFHSDSRSIQLVQKPDFRTHFNRVILNLLVLSQARLRAVSSEFIGRIVISDRRCPAMWLEYPE